VKKDPERGLVRERSHPCQTCWSRGTHSTASLSNDVIRGRKEGGSICGATLNRVTKGVRQAPLIAPKALGKLRFTIAFSYHMIVLTLCPLPLLQNKRVGIMEGAAYALVLVAVLASFKKPEATAC